MQLQLKVTRWHELGSGLNKEEKSSKVQIIFWKGTETRKNPFPIALSSSARRSSTAGATYHSRCRMAFLAWPHSSVRQTPALNESVIRRFTTKCVSQ